MSDRVILTFGEDVEEAACSESDCANRWRCTLHGEESAEIVKGFKPSAELVIAGGKGTLTCHDYWQGRKEHSFRAGVLIHTNAIAGERPRRGVRMPTGDRVMDRMTGADGSDLSA